MLKTPVSAVVVSTLAIAADQGDDARHRRGRFRPVRLVVWPSAAVP